ncbi:hypothetical protein J8F10_19055 [Gemmata sp. G18]|uniref:Uncharacterized protein n=1 Tax=Gemmata palustris TaxID=2822762 RepID=A0ABS5BUJ4_9BACT|nr:hypothetical protein [Gemmata palustris]MBP3957349.1 hypothetical protein [Gemmata palustris]
MSQILADAEMAKQIEAADGPVNIVDATGTVIAVCTPVKFPHSPYTREEVEERREEARKNPGGGKSLAEIMTRLNQLGGGRV